MLLPGALFVIAVTVIGGALAWVIVRRPDRSSAAMVKPVPRGDLGEVASGRWTDADDAAARHPAGRGKVTGRLGAPKGPDDDPEFLRALGRAIRRNPPVS